MEVIAIITGALALVVSTCALLYQIRRDKSKDLNEWFDKTNKLCERVLQIEVKIGPWWAVMEKMALDILHHPHMYERDALIDKYRDEGLDDEEKRLLIKMFLDTVDDKEAPPKEIFAAMMMSSILQAQLDQEEAE